jgi:hypothetical protein
MGGQKLEADIMETGSLLRASPQSRGNREPARREPGCAVRAEFGLRPALIGGDVVRGRQRPFVPLWTNVLAPPSQNAPPSGVEAVAFAFMYPGFPVCIPATDCALD